MLNTLIHVGRCFWTFLFCYSWWESNFRLISCKYYTLSNILFRVWCCSVYQTFHVSPHLIIKSNLDSIVPSSCSPFSNSSPFIFIENCLTFTEKDAGHSSFWKITLLIVLSEFLQLIPIISINFCGRKCETISWSSITPTPTFKENLRCVSASSNYFGFPSSFSAQESELSNFDSSVHDTFAKKIFLWVCIEHKPSKLWTSCRVLKDEGYSKKI